MITQILPVCKLSTDHPFLTPADLKTSRKDHCVDHKQAMLHGTTNCTLFLYIFFIDNGSDMLCNFRNLSHNATVTHVS